MNIPVDALDEALVTTRGGGPWALADALATRGVPRSEARSLARILTGVEAGGQLGATVRADGRHRRGPWVVGFLRHADHRWFRQLRRGDTLTAAPTDGTDLLRHWRELLARTG